ncbi:hypothetical protein [Bacillus sp. mrc49]|uniref:hypothetical protein n=1 Tax=Bacillus sp. mrc49 TaxID=2054913 RepID=UPI003FA48393
MIKDGEAYSANQITEKLVNFYKLTEEQRLKMYENSDIVFLSRVRCIRYSLKKENILRRSIS